MGQVSSSVLRAWCGVSDRKFEYLTFRAQKLVPAGFPLAGSTRIYGSHEGAVFHLPAGSVR